ncbi:Exosome complex exonuclease RRP45 [Operophtera brumata]|uniref:Exosome complex component RRP45 n=1 Tax=Operophtera brumata TaxID=104452 RepID=A0A0L7LF16_OPEBR|nr:Exosome complex exonuclease RRP45 [Operophtera brumata]
MRDTLISICEKNFLQQLVAEGHRLDGRNYNESRTLKISFGSSYGSCIVTLGETKVLAQVTCEVTQPKQVRPNEGILFINVDVGPMASPQFEANRSSDLSVYLNRLLEKCYKDSKCIDLESLCIVVEEKVWSIRVDIRVLNHDGNIIECASIATLTALAHFKRPDITRSGDQIIIHTIAEKDPIPTVLYHYPVRAVSCCFLKIAFMYSSIIVSDPSYLEESVCLSNTEEGISKGGGLLVIGMNQYKELCLLDLTGAAIDSSNIVHKAMASAADKCKDIVDLVKSTIASDDTLRQKREKVSFANTITQDHLLSLSRKDLNIRLKKYHVEDLTIEEDPMSEDDDSHKQLRSSRREHQNG